MNASIDEEELEIVCDARADFEDATSASATRKLLETFRITSKRPVQVHSGLLTEEFEAGISSRTLFQCSLRDAVVLANLECVGN